MEPKPRIHVRKHLHIPSKSNPSSFDRNQGGSVLTPHHVPPPAEAGPVGIGTRARMDWSSVRWPSGTTYEGSTESGIAQGHGVLRYSNGDRYEGEFRLGEMHGLGVYRWECGAKYSGEWDHGNMKGCGVLVGPGHDFRAGEFVDDQYVGSAIGCRRAEAEVSGTIPTLGVEGVHPDSHVPNDGR